MAKLGLIFLLLAGMNGCITRPGPKGALAPKTEDLIAGQSERTIRAFRIFGKERGYLADYDPATGSLRAIYNVVMTGGGRDYWQILQEDARLAREPRYFAVSRTALPAAVTLSAQESFRADLFRGHPVHESAVGLNIMIRVTGTRYTSPAVKPAGSHIMIGDAKGMHAVPLAAGDDLVSFAVIDGIKADEGRWASATLKAVNTRPATTAMGCEQNFEGELLADSPENGAEFRGICEQKAPAGM